MSRRYHVCNLADVITKYEGELVLHTEYNNLNLIPIIGYLLDRHCFYRNVSEMYDKCLHDAQELVLEFDINMRIALDAISSLDQAISDAVDIVVPTDYTFNITHRYLGTYSFLFEVYVFDTERSQIQYPFPDYQRYGEPHDFPVSPIYAHST